MLCVVCCDTVAVTELDDHLESDHHGIELVQFDKTNRKTISKVEWKWRNLWRQVAMSRRDKCKLSVILIHRFGESCD